MKCVVVHFWCKRVVRLEGFRSRSLVPNGFGIRQQVRDRLIYRTAVDDIGDPEQLVSMTNLVSSMHISLVVNRDEKLAEFGNFIHCYSGLRKSESRELSKCKDFRK